MVSTFYSSNQQKQKDYLRQRRLQEDNDFNQQEIVDNSLEKELGLEERATKTALMSQRVANKLASLNTEGKSKELLDAINSGTIDELFKKIQLLEDSSLNKNQQSIRDNLKIQRNKNILNEIINDSLASGPIAIETAIINALGGDDNINNVVDLIKKASKINIKDYTSVRQPTNKKQQNRENELMASEDINYALKPLPSKPATQEDIDKLNEAQAKLDLISLFQQDVKEGRKRQALKDLQRLNADEDLRLRRNFKKALDDMMDEVNNRNSDKAILNKMKQLIENKRMHDSFIDFSDLAIKDELRKKIARNLESMLFNKNFMNKIRNLARTNRSNVVLKEFNNQYNKYLNEKNKKSGYSSSDTDVDSTMGNASFRGRPRKFTSDNARNEALKKKEKADILSQKLYEKGADGKYIIRGKEREDLRGKINNLYQGANKIAKEFKLN